jgi:hypothetical protein
MAVTGCHTSEPFTTEKWMKGDGLQFPLRDDIMDDLLKNHKLKGMNYHEVTHLLSDPDGRDSVSFYYQIIETFNNMHQHDHTKNLVFYMGKDSIITRFEIYDKKFKKK